jgi:hypothetical protein
MRRPTTGDATRVSAHVGATFSSFPRQVLGPIFTTLHRYREDNEPTRPERSHLKHLIETGPRAQQRPPA